jgi:PhzF family phenazine biosynthesis protein
MKYYVVDAFADSLFKGNPAGVCLLDKEIPDDTMQSIAYENNLAETAFLIKNNGANNLRWFTPEMEMDLCGHATLAAAFIVLNYIDPALNEVSFKTQSGILTVYRADKGIYTMDFPSRMPEPVETPPLLEEALGCKILETHKSRDLVAVTDCENTVKNLKPNIELIKKISPDLAFAVIVTAAGDTCDFVSRFFAPNAGIIEDPVTGSAHSTLIPFWSRRLGRGVMTARQLSARGGTLYCRDEQERVKIGGTAVCYLQGELML